MMGILVYTNVVHGHFRRESDVFDVNESEILRHAQVQQNVL